MKSPPRKRPRKSRPTTKTISKRLVLWVRANDPVCENAMIMLTRIQRAIPSDIEVRVRTVSETKPQVIRVPCLLFKLGKTVVYRLERISEDAVLDALKRLGR